jgi:hypothetical protein
MHMQASHLNAGVFPDGLKIPIVKGSKKKETKLD